MMDNAAILAKVDHTLLKPEATWADIKKLCDEAKHSVSKTHQTLPTT